MDLDWYNGLWLFCEDNASVEKGRDNVVNKNVNSSFALVVKVVIVVKTLNGTAPHHSVHLPHFIVLYTIINTTRIRHVTNEDNECIRRDGTSVQSKHTV